MRTNAARKNVVVFRQIPDDLLERIRAWHDVVVADPRRAEELPRFREALHDADGLIGSSFKLGAEELARAPRLEVISSISVGVDNYDLGCLKERGITLCHTPGVLTETTADTVFALVIATSRRLVELSNHVRDGRWTRNIGEDLFGWDVHGKTLGVLGFGRIGQAVARRAALGFDMPVVFHDPFDVQVPASLAGYAVRASFDEVLARADIVALTLPLSDETRGLMDAQRILDDEARRDLRQRLARRDRARGRAAWPRSTAAICARPASMCSRSNRCRRIRRCAPIPRSRRSRTSARRRTRRAARWPNSRPKTCCACSTARPPSPRSISRRYRA